MIKMAGKGVDRRGPVTGDRGTGREEWNKWEERNKVPFVSTRLS